MRADAERNRRRLLDAATQMFCERGLDVGVGEIAQQAGVGRGTLFRNFPSKEHLIAAIVVERMNESISRGRAALEAPDPGQALFELIEQSVGRSQTDRALFDAIADTWLANDEIRAVHAELLGVLDALVRRAQDAGAVRARRQRRRRADDDQGRLRGGQLLPARQPRRGPAPARPRPRGDQRAGRRSARCAGSPADDRATSSTRRDARRPRPRRAGYGLTGAEAARELGDVDRLGLSVAARRTASASSPRPPARRSGSPP